MRSPPCVLILDPGRYECPLRICDQAPSLMPEWLQTHEIAIKVSTSPKSIEPAVPIQLVVIRISTVQPWPEISQLISQIRKNHRQAHILGLFCSSQVDCTCILGALENGLDDYICCPLREIDLLPRFQRYLRTDGKDASARNVSMESLSQFRHDSLVGGSSCFLEKLELVRRLASSDATLLIMGETGTGKELFAQAVHYQSNRKSKPFIPVNCGALPEQLFENELFGHMKGAYTNASSFQAGLVSEAEGGTLFLDEVDALTPSAQTKLLRFMQDGEFRHLGSPRCQKADIRIIAASNANMKERVSAKLFREDLYYRLSVLTLTVPPLRERQEDVSLLVTHFLKRYRKGNGESTVGCSGAAMEKLMGYCWPGNVRELEGVVQRALTFAAGSCLLPEDIDIPVLEAGRDGREGMRSAKSHAVGQFERNYLMNLLARSRGNVSQAAKTAGKERRTFQRLLKKYGLSGNAFRDLP
jgi:two-component system, NtrC family, response regulator GlrR